MSNKKPVLPNVTLHTIEFRICSLCLDGWGGQCHTAGCGLWLNRAPDLPLRDSPMVTKIDGKPGPAYQVSDKARYLVVMNRNPDRGDMDTIYLMTLEQWQRYRSLRDGGEDVCMAASSTLEDDEFGKHKAVGERPPYFDTYAELFSHVHEQEYVLMNGEVGIGY